MLFLPMHFPDQATCSTKAKHARPVAQLNPTFEKLKLSHHPFSRMWEVHNNLQHD